MASQRDRSRSTASNSTKSIARPASSTSTRSISAADIPTYTHEGATAFAQTANSRPCNSFTPYNSTQFPHVESALIQSLSNPDGLPLEQPAPAQSVPTHSRHHHHSLSTQQAQNAGYSEYSEYHQGQMPDMSQGHQNGSANIPSGAEAETQPKKKGPAANAANDRELRELIRDNENRSLKEVAAEVIRTERTARAEKTKQLFAMLWRCGLERVIPLNPASFGKLVRVIFPGIQTRRLGIRGESKYHYVDLEILDEHEEVDQFDRLYGNQSAAPPRRRDASICQSLDLQNTPRLLPADTALFPQHAGEASPVALAPPENSSNGRVFTDTISPAYSLNGMPTEQSYEQKLKFPDQLVDQFTDEAIQLPDITPYLPQKTDVDVAQSLIHLYFSHCTSLIDCVRYCKEKQFWRLFASFHGTLTVPVQKLLAQPDIAPWIKECDWLLYQSMIRCLKHLVLEVAPPRVINFLGNISNSLHGHISKTFQGHPMHVLEAKLEPATLFAGLLHRMLKANAAAHAAARNLIEDPVRNMMWRDWVMSVNPKRIIESELPNCGYEEAYMILTNGMRSLMSPTQVDEWLEKNTHYQNAALSARLSGHNQQSSETGTAVDRIAELVASLPSRFPHVEARTLVYCINAVGSAAMREIAASNMESFGYWWVFKQFVDEITLWYASLGGFLDHAPPGYRRPSPRTNESQEQLSQDAGGDANAGTKENSRASSLSMDVGADSFVVFKDMPQNKQQSQTGNGVTALPQSCDTAQFTPTFESVEKVSATAEPDHEDSGIGMSLLEDSFTAPNVKAEQAIPSGFHQLQQQAAS